MDKSATVYDLCGTRSQKNNSLWPMLDPNTAETFHNYAQNHKFQVFRACDISVKIYVSHSCFWNTLGGSPLGAPRTCSTLRFAQGPDNHRSARWKLQNSRTSRTCSFSATGTDREILTLFPWSPLNPFEIRINLRQVFIFQNFWRTPRVGMFPHTPTVDNEC